MEFTQEAIDALIVNEVEIMKKVADEINIRVQQVSAVISLVEEGCTIPFISRYRKEKHGSLDEVQVRDCDHLFKSYKNLEERRLEIVKGIFGQGKLTDSLYNAAMSATTLTELEDLWAPFKKKKKTRGMVAIEKGLDALADAMLELDDVAIEEKAKEFYKSRVPSYDIDSPYYRWTREWAVGELENILKKNSKIKQEEIAQQIGKSLRTVKSRMIEMQEKGLIERKHGRLSWNRLIKPSDAVQPVPIGWDSDAPTDLDLWRCPAEWMPVVAAQKD